MTREEQLGHIQAVTAVLPDNPVDAMTVLMHVVAGYFSVMKSTPREVTAWYMKITQMLDGKFDR